MKSYLKYIFFVSLLVSCTEIYEPELKDVPQVLVIDGLITDELKAHIVKVSMAIPYDTAGYVPVSDAIVYVTDNDGNRFDFLEYSRGEYRSDQLTFIPQIGKKYFLTVETGDEIYRSTSQELLPNTNEPSINNAFKTIEVYQFNGTEQVLKTVLGADIIAFLNLGAEANYYYRFANTVLTQFTSIIDSDGLLRYNWKKYNPNQYFNVNNIQFNNSGTLQHNLGFFPLDTIFYGVVLGVFYPGGPGNPPPIITRRYLKSFHFTIKQYRLNDEVHSYYQSVNKQLEAKQRFFDPISAQINGNIKCISDTTEEVFGLFEASSMKIKTFRVFEKDGGSYRIQEIAPVDMDNIPDSGETIEVPPLFWIN